MQEIKLFADRTEPQISEGTVLILVQDGNCEVSRYHLPGPDDYSHYLSHPVNSKELGETTQQLVARTYPDFSDWEASRLFICPAELVAQAQWLDAP
ncbi:hypothetical protein HLB42_06895 [Deinococcus sp. D7000]|nr:hypothetical protein HLB42_06895 [Deinococcus sp. D7000]